MKYRLIESRRKNAFMQMAVDEAILNAVIENKSPETIRFFDFLPPAITIGRLQNIEGIDVGLCRKKGIDLVRRLTGGRAVFHSGDFTFSLILKKNNKIFGGTVYETYETISSTFLLSLRSLNIPVKWERLEFDRRKKRTIEQNPLCFSSISRYELTLNNKKVLGISQYRKKDAILVQGSLLLKKPSTAFIDLFETSITLKEFSYIEEDSDKKVSFEDFVAVLKNGIEKTYRITVDAGGLSKNEMEQTKILQKKYKSTEWNSYSRHFG